MKPPREGGETFNSLFGIRGVRTRVVYASQIPSFNSLFGIPRLHGLGVVEDQVAFNSLFGIPGGRLPPRAAPLSAFNSLFGIQGL